jgi:putative ABC transport system ATP-binding protein
VSIVFRSSLLPTLTVAKHRPADGFRNTFPARERSAGRWPCWRKVGIAESPQTAGRPRQPATAPSPRRWRMIRSSGGMTDGQPDRNFRGGDAPVFDLTTEGFVVMVTHERDLNRYFTRTILLSDGVIVSNTEHQHA